MSLDLLVVPTGQGDISEGLAVSQKVLESVLGAGLKVIPGQVEVLDVRHAEAGELLDHVGAEEAQQAFHFRHCHQTKKILENNPADVSRNVCLPGLSCQTP